MNHTKVIDLADKVGGVFRLAVLLQKRVRELVGGAPKLVKTDLEDPIDIALLEVEEDAIELVDLSDEELASLEAQSQMASEEAELLEALRSRVTRGSTASTPAAPAKAAAPAPAPAAAAAPAAKEEPEAVTAPDDDSSDD